LIALIVLILSILFCISWRLGGSILVFAFLGVVAAIF